MYITCLDMEGVLVPEIWIAFAEASGIPELRRTTRDEPDYDKLMAYRLAILKEHGLGLKEIQAVIARIDPLPGAKEFLDALRAETQVIILSDTFEQFAKPLMAKLGWPTIFCNTLTVADSGEITGYQMRCEKSKLTTVKALQSIGYQTIASGDSYNDLGMIQASKAGFLFRSTDQIKADYPQIPAYETYDELLAALEEGNSLAEFRENMNDFLEAEGYEGITPYQAENIFRTNIQTAYNVGHYKQMTEPGVKALRPYWQYDAVNDSKTRPSHLAMDGRVFMADDPIWDTWFPPNGFKCRCTVKTLSKRQMEQRGLTVETEAPRAARLEDGRFVNILPDPQFDTNPAKVRYQPDLTGYPEPLKKAYQEREKGNTPP